MADLNGDGVAEIIFATYGSPQACPGCPNNQNFFVLSSTGALLSLVALPSPANGGNCNGAISPPTIADLNNNGLLETYIATCDGRLLVYEFGSSGTNCLLWPNSRGGLLRWGAPDNYKASTLAPSTSISTSLGAVAGTSSAVAGTNSAVAGQSNSAVTGTSNVGRNPSISYTPGLSVRTPLCLVCNSANLCPKNSVGKVCRRMGGKYSILSSTSPWKLCCNGLPPGHLKYDFVIKGTCASTANFNGDHRSFCNLIGGKLSCKDKKNARWVCRV